jgi:hypothetical protein
MDDRTLRPARDEKVGLTPFRQAQTARPLRLERLLTQQRSDSIRFLRFVVAENLVADHLFQDVSGRLRLPNSLCDSVARAVEKAPWALLEHRQSKTRFGAGIGSMH